MRHTVTLSQKGQITVPAHIRRQLHLESGSELEVQIQDDRLILARQESTIESAFGICKADVTVSLEDMEHVSANTVEKLSGVHWIQTRKP